MSLYYKRLNYSFITILCGVALAFPIPSVFAQTSQTLSLRAIQTRSFETTNMPKMLQNIASTLQDMGYIIGRIDNQIGFINATQFADNVTEITVNIQPQPHSMIVRVSARRNNIPMDNDPVFYQDFFNHLSQASFLNTNSIY
ncbi:hypothetical protein [Commensalibacter intestini]|nr:hypothetical protein [Commensalibacter intestini]